MSELVIAPEVAAALAEGRPVVALESTIIAHGLPFPANRAIAADLEDAVRSGGAVPATIAIVAGRACIGLESATLDQLAERGRAFAKAGATDLAVHLARGTDAATTVSATAVLAARAGIRVFATGGIGGVHRGDGSDVSHDLVAMARTPIAVISAGAKAILDLPRTLETLETLGVLVLGWRTGELPAFYTRTSGLALEHRVDDIAELAAIARVRFALGQGGILVANPIPAEAALDVATIDAAITEALAAADAQHVTGKRITPFLLARLAEVTGGAAVRANRALALANAQVGAELAAALVDQRATV
ncbi:MAG: pseudouridine-5'-phosphate glycosidase [Deltaproteobacteria bacterium]|nr:pseudouridine-5'-phosphate glycosidase [Deltaproteobacteria bacterium]